MLVGIAASGRTPYVAGGLRYADQLGAFTVSVSCTLNSLIGSLAQLQITPLVGPEVITGSTRLKAGTAQKMVLNMLTTTAMIRLGKVYGNLMVDVKPSNGKLLERAKRIVAEAAGVSYVQAAKALGQANGNPKLAIVMLKKGCAPDAAKRYLDEAQGFIGRILNNE
jgi:N-acetylmuramic acid 6-phosphate etherase